MAFSRSAAAFDETKNIFDSIVNDVITDSRESFENEGVGEEVLNNLKRMWISKFEETKVLTPDPSAMSRYVSYGANDPYARTITGMSGVSAMGAAGYTAAAAASSSFYHPISGVRPTSTAATSVIRPTQRYGTSSGVTEASQAALFALQQQQLDGQFDSYTDEITKEVTDDILSTVIDSNDSHRLQPSTAAVTASPEPMSSSQLSTSRLTDVVPNSSTAFVDHKKISSTSANSSSSSTLVSSSLSSATASQPSRHSAQAREPAIHLVSHTVPPLSQLDGETGGGSSSEEEDDDELKNLEKIELPPATDDAEDTAAKGAVEGTPLNSDDDDKDDLIMDQEFGPSDLVLCQFERVSRRKNSWKINLKDGVMLIKNKEYLFNKAVGQTEW